MNFEIKKHCMSNYYLTMNFSEHKLLQKHLLKEIDKNSSHKLIKKDEYYSDNVDKLDWQLSNELTRSWVKIIKPYLEYITEIAVQEIGFSEIFPIETIWFQQYYKSNTHGWHIHGNNFSAVYYLELPQSAPVTELLDMKQNRIFTPDIQEGDILIFPSTTIHRAPILDNNCRKTIISYNFDIKKIDKALLEGVKF